MQAKKLIYLLFLNMVLTHAAPQSPALLAQQMLDLSEKKGSLAAQVATLGTLESAEAQNELAQKQKQLDEVSKQLDDVQNSWTKQIAAS